MITNPYTVIGTRQPMVDALEKVTGTARFTADLVLPRMLAGKLLGSPHPHAKIINVDKSKALAVKGVKAVITGSDIPGRKYGTFVSRRDETGLTKKARYVGDPIAAVAAVDEETAMEALGRIKVEYDVLPAVLNPKAAMAMDAPLIHDEYERNIVAYRYFDFGDIEAGFKTCDLIREDHFSSQSLSHAALEPRSVIAHYDPSAKLSVWTSTQAPYKIRRGLSLVLDLPLSRIRVVKPYTGGGFGGKGELTSDQVAAALLSMRTGRPVKISLSREEEISATRVRAAMTMDVKTGVKKDGTIVAQQVKCLADGGAYASTSVLLIYNAGLTCLIPYRIPNFRYEGRMVYTNKAVSGPMRGHGANQPRFAVESQLDMIAEQLHMDPMELRLKNATQAGDISVNGLNFSSCELTRAITTAAEKSQWTRKKERKTARRGIGIACGGFVCGARSGGHTASGTFVHVNEDGGVTLLTGSSDIGQGSKTVLAQMVAEELGLPLSKITVISGDTEVTPIDPGTFSSRVTFYAGNATLIAARDVKAQLAQAAATLLEANCEDLVFQNEKIYVRGSATQFISFGELAKKAEALGHGRLIIGHGQWAPMNTQFPDKKTQYGNVSGAYSFAAQIAEVDVDPETGEVSILKLTIGDDCGQVINVLGVEGQAEGSVAMGIGHAITESLKFADNGQIMNPSFLDYRIPSAKDCSDSTLLEVGTPDLTGPYGAKEIGEGLLIATVPAICNAVYDAVGARIKDLPITPEKIIQELKSKKTGK